MVALRILTVLVACMLGMTAQGQVQDEDYSVLSPAQPSGTPGKVEVVEFFSYGCPHCYAMHPLLSEWAAQLPAGAVLVRVPVSLGRRPWGQLSRAYYALEATGDLSRLDGALFQAIHKDNRPLFDEESITAWVVEHGVDAAKFATAFNSFAVSAKTVKAEQMSRDYRVAGIPHLNVAGKYTVLGDTHEEQLANARGLVDKAVAELPPAKQ
jgi:protein dithiol oxidoreductase (disulfide-forming)